MKSLIRMVQAEMKKEFGNWKLYAAVIGFYIMSLVVCKDYRGSGALASINILLGLSNTVSLLVIIAAMPSACTFFDDWDNGFYKFIVNRSSVNKYIATKILTCLISTFMVAFVSFSLFGLTLYVIQGVGAESFYPGAGFYSLVHSNYNVLYIFVRAGLFSIVLCVYSSYALAGSAIFPNKFVAIAFPLISGIILQEVSDWLSYEGVSLHAIQECVLTSAREMWIGFGMIIVYLVVAHIIFAWVVKRRIRCEIN